MLINPWIFRFLSNWSSVRTNETPLLGEEDEREEELAFGARGVGLSNGFTGRRHPSSRRMIARSKSEMRVKPKDTMATSLVDGKPSSPQTKVKGRLATAIRRSFRKKNKETVFQECEDDFTFSQSASSTPVLRTRSKTLNSLQKGVQLDSDSLVPSDVSQSPARVHPSIRVEGSLAKESESSGDNQDEGATEEKLLRYRDKKRSVSHSISNKFYICIRSMISCL